MKSVDLSHKDKQIIVATVINAFNQAVAHKKLVQLSRNTMKNNIDDDLMIMTINEAISHCSHHTRLIIENEFIAKKPRGWHEAYFSRSSYYRYCNQALDEFIANLNL